MATSITPLNTTSSLLDLYNTINSLIAQAEEENYLLDSLTSSSIGEKARYTSTGEIFITGEVYSVLTTGEYRVSSEGTGSGRFIVHDQNGQTVVDIRLDNAEVSEPYWLSAGYEILFYANAAIGTDFSMILNMTGNLSTNIYTIMNDTNEMRTQILLLQSQVAASLATSAEINQKATTILENFTVQYNGLSAAITGLDQRVTALENT